MKKIVLLIVLICLLTSCKPTVKNGLFMENGKTYYYVDDEKKVGWYIINDDWYVFDSTGAMLKDTIYDEIDATYYLSDTGKMVRNYFLKLENDKYMYFDDTGKAISNISKEINNKIYIFDLYGIGKVQPDYILNINCIFPKMFSSFWGNVLIENINYEYNEYNNSFITFWTGTDSYHISGYTNTAVEKTVGYKLLDPDGYVVDTGTFRTDALHIGDKFRDKERTVYMKKDGKKGVYTLDLYDSKY